MKRPFPLQPALRSALFALLLAVVSGCSVLPTPAAPDAMYDLGPLPEAAPPKLARSVVVHEALAPAWMDGPGMHYRLMQRAPAQPLAYANSRWVMPPAALLTARLKSRLAEAGPGVYAPADGLRADLVLRLELDEFAQWFDAPTASRGVLRVRALLAAGREAPLQKTFVVERPAPSADAAGGARALIAASDEAVAQILAWVAAYPVKPAR